MALRAISDLDVRGKRLVVRADLNVPLEDGRLGDMTRISRFAEGMRPLLARGARLVILTHFARPEPGRFDAAFSVSRLVGPLRDALGVPVAFAPGCVDEAAAAMSRELADGTAMLCENLRFHPGETANDRAFAGRLADLGDIYVNDAFSCAHRAHASTEALARLLPAASGPLLLRETTALDGALDGALAGTPGRTVDGAGGPSVAVVGGPRASERIAVLRHLVERVDAVILGDGVANSFLAALRRPMGRSRHEPEIVPVLREITRRAHARGCRILLPQDVVVAREPVAGAPFRVVRADACPPDAMILDAGPETLARLQAEIARARRILWTGALGAVRVAPFGRATFGLARTAAALSRAGLATTVAGGGDTAWVLAQAGVTQDFTHVSAAGGAFLETLEGRTLPGIAALDTAARAA